MGALPWWVKAKRPQRLSTLSPKPRIRKGAPYLAGGGQATIKAWLDPWTPWTGLPRWSPTSPIRVSSGCATTAGIPMPLGGNGASEELPSPLKVGDLPVSQCIVCPLIVTLDLGMGPGAPGASVVIQATLRVSDDTDVGAIEISLKRFSREILGRNLAV